MDFYFIDKISSRAGAIEKERLSQLCILDKQEIGRIYRGKVQSFAKNLDACFVDIGLKSNGLLKIKDCIGSVAVGDNVIVEVKRSAQGTKGPLLSMKYSLSGKNLVYLPFESGVFVSKNCSVKFRKKMNDMGQQFVQKIKQGGIIMRTGSERTTLELLELEMNHLIKLYESLHRERNFLPSPKLLYIPEDKISQLLQNKNYPIVTNDELWAKRLKAQDFDVKYDENFRDIYDSNIRVELEKLESKQINLPGGGEIIIDHVEALTAIDINTAGAKGDSFSEVAHRVNLEAIEEITQQIFLRDIGGIIIIDFLRESKRGREEIFLKIKEGFVRDIRETEIYGYTKSGLFEIVRQKG